MTATLPAPCDRASAAAKHGGKAPHQQWTLVATILASSSLSGLTVSGACDRITVLIRA